MIIARQRKNKAREIADSLRDHIQSGTLPAGTSIASTKDLAAEYQVPFSTANRAVCRLVDEGWLYRQHGSGTFVKGDRHQERRPWRIGYYDMSDVAQPTNEGSIVFEIYTRLILNEFSKYNCQVERIGFHDLKSAEHCAATFPRLDAILVSAALLDPQTEKNLYHFKKPILIYRNIVSHHFPATQVISDWSVGIRQMLELIDISKYDKYLLLATSNRTACSTILDEFRRQSQYFNIRPDQIEERLVQPTHGTSEQLFGYKLGMTFEPDARTFIFSVSDFVSFGILEAWRERGIPVGKYPLVGSFNMEGQGVHPFEEPLVTSINQDKGELSRRSVSLIISALEQQDYYPQTIRIPSELIIRKSAFGS